MIRTALTLALLLCATALHAQNDADAARVETKARRVLQLTDAGAMARTTMEQMLPQMRQILPQVPEKFWTEFQKEIDVDGLLELMVPVYVDEFTEEELDAMIAFYESPTGKRIVTKLPAVNARSMEAGQQWGMQLGLKIMEKLQEKGYQPKS